MSLFELVGKIIVVTGGYGYLGAGICKGLARLGAVVYIFGKSKERFASRFDDDNINIHFIPCDISNASDIKKSFADVFEKHKTIDALINNAIYVRGRKPLEISEKDWAYTIDGGLTSVYRCIREFVPYLLKRGGGKILNISSIYGMVSPKFDIYDNFPDFLNPPSYGAAKAGVIQLTKYFAQYLGQHNIQVNAISPGSFPNELVQEDEQFVEALKKRTSLGRIGQPDDLIGAVVFLISSASDFVTGHNLVVDGGWTIT